MAKTIEGRIDNVAGDLTVKERACLVLAAWCEDEEPDEALLRPLRYGDEIEHRKLVERVADANSLAGGQLSYWQEYVCELEVYLLWLESNRQWQERYGSPVPGTGEPSRWNAGAGLTPLVGTRTRERWDDEPPRLDRLSEALEDHIARDLAQRWRALAAVDAIFAELSAEYGCATMHRVIRQAVAELRAKLLDLRQRLGLVPEVELPGPTEEEVEALRAIVFSDEATA
ncbi:hypothetical protein J0H33_05995 [bacterium]|nr:hypothetical protein [bacterium]